MAEARIRRIDLLSGRRMPTAGRFTPDRFTLQSKEKDRSPKVLNDLEFAYTPVRDKVRDLREYL